MATRRIFSLLLAGIALALLSGCGSALMQTMKDSPAPAGDRALVTFVRPTSFGGAIKFSLWDGEKFIGILTANANVPYLATPGEHLFVASSENWSYVKADLQAGKRYVIVGRVFPGVWRARVALNPVTKKSEYTQKEIDHWFADTTPMEVIAVKAPEYVEPRLEEVRKAITEYQAGKVKYGVLEPDDGR